MLRRVSFQCSSQYLTA